MTTGDYTATQPAAPGTLRGDTDKFAQSPAVTRWLVETAGPVTDLAGRASALESLQGFCAFVGAGPDELVAQCLRPTKSGGTAISTVGRRSVNESVEAFAAAQGLTGHDAIVLGNRLRGFLIHNGIFLQGPASIS